MKREALRHPKMLDLAARLRIPREHAIGIVSVLIDWVHDMAPQGDVGKWPDGAIAVASGWSGDPHEFINALIEARWLDSHPHHRLLVHDYPDHAERFVKAKLSKTHQWFCKAYYSNGRTWDAPNGILPPAGEFPNLPEPTAVPAAVGGILPPAGEFPNLPEQTAVPSAVGSIVRSIEPTAPCDQTKPNQTKPNHPLTPAKDSTAVASQSASQSDGGGNIWNIDSESHCRLALKRSGYKRCDELIRQVRDLGGVTPQDVLAACEEFEANKDRFESPGAIGEKLRSGHWPVDGVLPFKEAFAKKETRKQMDREKVIASARYRLVKEVDNNAREWDDLQVIAVGRKKGFL